MALTIDNAPLGAPLTLPIIQRATEAPDGTRRAADAGASRPRDPVGRRCDGGRPGAVAHAVPTRH